MSLYSFFLFIWIQVINLSCACASARARLITGSWFTLWAFFVSMRVGTRSEATTPTLGAPRRIFPNTPFKRRKRQLSAFRRRTKSVELSEAKLSERLASEARTQVTRFEDTRSAATTSSTCERCLCLVSAAHLPLYCQSVAPPCGGFLSDNHS